MGHRGSMLREDNGNLSSIRIYGFIALCGFMIEWMHWVFMNSSRFDPSPTTIAFVLGLIAGKVVQKFGEEKVDSTKEDH